MKKKIIESCALLILALFLASVPAEAQLSEVHSADIPFDFMIGNETYQAGRYTFRVEEINQLASVLKITSAENDPLQDVAVLKNGSVSDDGITKLIFRRYGSMSVLGKIVAPKFGFNAPKAKMVKRLSRKFGEKPKVIIVVLRRAGGGDI